ncbi:carbohydrate binding family 9 domain-containing protein, partial [bacterium]|nr:carbohydrate binding family 9 domain-containing protein [bacterium]
MIGNSGISIKNASVPGNLIQLNRLFLFVSMFFALSPAFVPTAAGDSTGVSPEYESVVVARLKAPVNFDGLSEEEAWNGITTLPMIMQIPHFGDQPSERTEVLVAYDDNYLYIAGRLYDREPSSVQGTTYKRDDSAKNSDSFGVAIDTFNDSENALAFITTPTGSRLDQTISDLGNVSSNGSWNTFWDVKTVVNDQGWFVEIRIPFHSLRFQERDGKVVMRLSAFRWIARKDEMIVYPRIPQDWGANSHMKPSMAQPVVFEGIRSTNPLYVTPYVLGGIGQDYGLNDEGTAYVRDDDPETEAGFDAKYSLTNNLTLDVTVNTDFAQVEADNQQVNLTRYSLFFPEKRQFFLERASNFEFNFYSSNRLFYSRQIGIHDGRKVPIYGGVRLVGRAGQWDIGALSMQTEEISDLPSENFSVVRLRRRVLNPNTYIGGIVTSRTGADGSYNTAYGVDGIFRLFGDDNLKLNWAQTFDDGAKNDPVSLDPANLRIHWERYRYTGWAYGLNYSYSGKDYNPGMGFEQNPNSQNYIHFLRYGWNPGKQSRIFQHQVYEDFYLHKRNDDDSIEYFYARAGWVLQTRSGSNGHICGTYNYETVSGELAFSDDAVVPEGTYEFYGVSGNFSTPGGRLFTLSTEIDAGQFYDGSRISMETSLSRSISSHLEVGGSYEYNHVRFPERSQRFISHIGQFRGLIMVNTSLSLTAFVQYNSAQDIVISNLRL